MGMPKRIDAKRAEQARRCYELDLAGFSQRQIAEKVGISQTTVHNRLKEHIQNRVHRKAEEWRDRQLDDLMVLRRKLVGAIESGDIKAIGQAVRIWERISKLMGTDSATLFKVEAEVHTRETDALEVQRIMDQFYGENPDKAGPQVIPHEVVTRHKRPRTEFKPITYSTPQPHNPENEFTKDNTFQPHEVQTEAVHIAEDVEPAPRPRRRTKTRTVPNPAQQFLRDADDD